MTKDQREIKRKKRVIEYAEKSGNIKTTCIRGVLGAGSGEGPHRTIGRSSRAI